MTTTKVQPVSPSAIERTAMFEETQSRHGPAMGGQDTPTVLGDYRLQHKLGEGGMGAVYKAMHQRLEKTVAVKVLAADKVRNPDAVARFEREMKAVGKLQHPHIIQALDAREELGVRFLVLEYIDGWDLNDVCSHLSSHLAPRDEPPPQNAAPAPIGIESTTDHVPQSGSPPDAVPERLISRSEMATADACELIRQAALGLQHAHEHGLVHRDIKPSNLFLAITRNRRGEVESASVKVLDLGLALLQQAGADLTSTGQIMGTLDYIAPEQIAHTHAVDIRADLYSLGCTLFKLLTGSAPFSGPTTATAVQKINAHAHLPPPSLAERRPDAPPGLSAVLDKLLAKSPAARFADPSELLAALTPFCVGHNLPALAARLPVRNVAISLREMSPPQPPPPPSPPSPPTPAAAPRRTNRLITRSVMATLFAALLLAGIIIKIRHKDGRVEEIKVPDGAKVEIEQANAESEPKPDAKTTVTAPATATDPYRRAASEILAAGGTLSVIVGPSFYDRIDVKHAGELPSQPFVLGAVDLRRRQGWTDGQTRSLRDIHWINTLVLSGTSITDDSIEMIAGIVGSELQLQATGLTDTGINRLRPELGWWRLYLGSTTISDSSTTALADQQRLRLLDVAMTQITEDGLRHLANSRSLISLISPQLTKADAFDEFSRENRLRSLIPAAMTGPDGTVSFPSLERITSLRAVFLDGTFKVADARGLQTARPDIAVCHPNLEVLERESDSLIWALKHCETVRGRKPPDFVHLPIVAADTRKTVGSLLAVFPYPNAPTTGIENLLGLRHVEKLQWFQLLLDDKTCNQIARFDSLQTVYGDARLLTAEGLAHLASLPDLESLTLVNAPGLTDEAWQPFSQKPFLRELRLRSSAISDGVFNVLGRCINLDSLELPNCPNVTHAGITQLEALHWLWVLDLRGNAQLDDRAAESLSRLKSLRLLFLSGTKISPAAIARLHESLPKCAIFWDGPTIIPGATSDREK